MVRVVLIHWRESEAGSRAAGLRDRGFDVRLLSPDGGNGLAPLLADPPAAIVIDLDRVPSQGAAVGTLLRQRKATRLVPLLFAGGAEEKVAKVRALLPDAAFAPWRSAAAALQELIAAPGPASPVVPGTMAGYSGTPLPRKLGIGPGATVLLLGAPKGFEAALGVLPDGTRVTRRAKAGNVLLLFAPSRAALEAGFPAAFAALAEKGRLWIAWPKKASGVTTDVTEPVVRAFGLGRGLVDFKICAIDATWSGLCFVRRKPKA